MCVLELWVIFTFALVFSSRVQVSNSQNITCNSNDLQALEACLIGLDSGTINGWETSTCCNWLGITCKSSTSLSFFNDPIDSSRVVKLELSGKILASKLNETTFTGLDQLTTLNLSINFLRGSLPSSLFQISNLQVIDLSKNDFSGSILMSINLHFLEIFDIFYNSFKSSVPVGVCINSTRIRIINFARNYFYGRIPYGFGNCSSLEHLWLGPNFLAGDIPEDIFWLPRLNQLGLRDNRFSGELSSGIGNLSDLVGLPERYQTKLFSPGLNSQKKPKSQKANPLPKRSLNKLECLISKDVLLEDPTLRLPFRFSFQVGVRMLQYNQIWSLQPTLDFSNNSITGPIWPEFGNLKKLHYLVLKCNNLSGNIPEDLSGMTSIETLDLSHNDLSGAIPHSLVNLNFLSKFNVAYNKLYGAIPTGGQIETFPNSSFKGNLGLCSGEHSSWYPISNQVSQVVSPSKLMWGEIIVRMSFGLDLGLDLEQLLLLCSFLF